MSETKTRGLVRVEPGLKRVRAFLGGDVVIDTFRPLLVWESPHYPTYYIPFEDTHGLVPTATTTHSPSRGDAAHFTVKAGGKEAVDAAWQYADSPIDEIRGAVRFEWDALDAWFEEDEEVYVHVRSPYTRIDILPSSRHVRVLVDGEVVAESHRPWLLFETGLPVRYYLPKLDVRMDLLDATDSQTRCPYKGEASYWSIRAGGTVHKDLAWSYPRPLPESMRVAGLVAFYNEKVDIEVDGVLEERPGKR